MLTIFVDLKLASETFWLNFGMFLRLAVMMIIFFYYIPRLIFPQNLFPKRSAENILYNIFMMTAVIETVIPLLIFLKIYSLALFLIVLFLIRLGFLKFYEKKEVIPWINQLYQKAFIAIMDFFDRLDAGTLDFKRPIKDKIDYALRRITPFKIIRFLLKLTIFGYAIYFFMVMTFTSLADAVPDISQYIQWISYLDREVLYSSFFQSSANFYGPPIFMFFLKSISNVDLVVLPRVYPIFIVIMLYFSLYFTVTRIYKSQYAGLFSVMVLSLVLFSPLAYYVIGDYEITAHPHVVEFLGMKFYTSDPSFFWGVKKGSEMLAWKPIERFMGGLGFEFSVSIYLLNLYFFIQTFKTARFNYLLMYGLTLFLVFVFHSGLAVYLVVASLLILIHTIFFGYLTWKLFWKGLATILLASTLGSLWLLSILEFGLFESIGAALPIFDVIFKTQKTTAVIASGTLDLVEFNFLHLFFLALTLFAYIIFIILPKHRYERSAILLSIFAIFFIFFAPNLGLPTIVAPARTSELYLLNLALLFGALFALFVVYPLRLIAKRYTQKILIVLLFILFAILSSAMPKWYNTPRYYAYIDRIGYSASSHLIYELSQKYLPFSWTLVDWVQESPKVAESGYHLNVFDLIQNYRPDEKYLKIPTRYIFIVVQKHPNRYRGKGEWYYRWRKKIYNKLRTWIAIFSMTHDNIKLYRSTPNLDIYMIDNKAYLDYLEKKRVEKLKKKDRRR